MAVIVILAIIALIAVPIILNIIDDSKKSAILVSGKNYIRAIEQQILSKNIKEKFSPQVCIIQEDGNLICDGDKLFTVEVSGSKPTSGEIKLNNKKIIEITEMILDGYVLEMELNKDLVLLGTTSEVLEPPLDPKGTYLMKGSSGNAASTFLGGSITKESVETITVTYTNKVPSNAIGSWDASAAQDGSIVAWYIDKDNNSLYELYIGGEGGVKANPDSSHLFSYFSNATIIDLKYLDTSQVKYYSNMFYYCNKLINLDLSTFNTSNAVNMLQMFFQCHKLENLNIDNFNTSNVTNMAYLFTNCYKLTNLDLSSFDTRNVTNMSNMFSGCSNLTTLNLVNFSTDNVTNIANMFSSCSSLTRLDLSSFNTSNVVNISSMFSYCNNLIGITFGSNWNTSNVTNMKSMFSGCKSLIELDLSNFDTNSVTDMTSMFYDCQSLINLNLSDFITNNVTSTNLMFAGCSKLKTIDIRKATFTNVTNYNFMFSSNSSLTNMIVRDSDAQTFINVRLAEKNITGVTVTIA